MNRFIKIMLIVSSIMAILGIILIGTGTFTGAKLNLRVRGTGIEIASSEKIQDSNLELEEFKSIKTDLGYSDINILEGENFGIEMLFCESEYIPEYAIEDGILYITDNSNKEGKYNFVNLDLSFGFEKNVINIYVPEGTTLDNADVTIDSGDINIENVAIENIKTSNGLGHTNISLLGESKDYSLDLSTPFGVIIIDQKIKGLKYKNIMENSPFTVEAKNSCGSIELTIEN